MKSNFSLLVNTTDSFEDCWVPFFTLFKKHWPGFDQTIYLNTETKQFSFPGLNIVSIRNGLHRRAGAASWSACLKQALDLIPDKPILYMQEDYFLTKEVKAGLIEHFAGVLVRENIDCIHLTTIASAGPFSDAGIENLQITDRFAGYRISLQPALWKKSALRETLRSHENPWMLEKYGTLRSRYMSQKICNVRIDKFNNPDNAIFSYIFTGIIKGKWHDGMGQLAKEQGLTIDFSERGFFSERKIPPLPIRALNKIRPAVVINTVRSQMGVFRLKLIHYARTRFILCLKF